MATFNHIIKSEMGIHARPALELVKEAQKYKSDIFFEAKGQLANAKEVMEIMSLVLKKGDALKIQISGADENEAIEIMKRISVL